MTVAQPNKDSRDGKQEWRTAAATQQNQFEE
jgi:hypothetical protein